MAEAADDLSTPLGQETVRERRRFRLPFTATQALAVRLLPCDVFARIAEELIARRKQLVAFAGLFDTPVDVVTRIGSSIAGSRAA